MTRSRTAEWITICCWTLAYNFLVPIRYTQWFFYSIAAKRRVMTKSSSIHRGKFGRKFWDRKKSFRLDYHRQKNDNFQFFLLQRNSISPPGNVSWKNVTKRFLIVSSEFYNLGRGIEAVYLFYDTFRVKKWNIFWYHFFCYYCWMNYGETTRTRRDGERKKFVSSYLLHAFPNGFVTRMNSKNIFTKNNKYSSSSSFDKNLKSESKKKFW